MDLTEAEALIEASDQHRLLRRVPPVADWALSEPVGEVRRAVFVDTETTGLDHEADEVIELALLPFEYERESGRIVASMTPALCPRCASLRETSRRRARAFTEFPTPTSRVEPSIRSKFARSLSRRT